MLYEMTLKYTTKHPICIKTEVDQWNKIETLVVNPRTNHQLIIDKCSNNIYWEKNDAF